MGFLDDYLRSREGASVQQTPESSQRTRQQDVVNTNLCSFARAIRRRLQDPLPCDDVALTPLEWYTAACSEEGPTETQRRKIQTMSGRLASFTMGNFFEFRVMRALEVLQSEGFIDGYHTNFRLPKVKRERMKRDDIYYRQEEVLLGKNMDLDPYKIDMLAFRNMQDGICQYLPLQLKSRKGRSLKRNGCIVLEQHVAARLRKELPALKDCFDSLQTKRQALRVRHQYPIIFCMRQESASQPKTLEELKGEIIDAFNKDGTTFQQKPRQDFSDLSFLVSLFQADLLHGVRQR